MFNPSSTCAAENSDEYLAQEVVVVVVVTLWLGLDNIFLLLLDVCNLCLDWRALRVLAWGGLWPLDWTLLFIVVVG